MAAAASRLEALVGPKQDTLNQAWKQGGWVGVYVYVYILQL
jgi:hypothetical protein